MDQLWHYVIGVSFLTSSLALATPLGFAALGGMVSERAGVVNIALEGMLLAAAFGSVFVMSKTGQVWLSVLFGMASAGIIGVLLAVFAVWGRINQIIVGISLNLFTLGITGVLASIVFSQSPSVPRVHRLQIPLLHRIPVLGPSLFSQSVLFYLLFVVAAALVFVLFRTRVGLSLRAVGENVGAAESAGLRPGLIRAVAVVLSGLIAGLGGVFIALAQSGSFSQGMTGGVGYLAFAILILADRRPVVVLISALLFGAIQSIALELQVVAPSFPPQFTQMIPHLITVVVFVAVGAKAFAPGELGRPLRVRR